MFTYMKALLFGSVALGLTFGAPSAFAEPYDYLPALAAQKTVWESNIHPGLSAVGPNPYSYCRVAFGDDPNNFVWCGSVGG